jgi:hypothetical protein
MDSEHYFRHRQVIRDRREAELDAEVRARAVREEAAREKAARQEVEELENALEAQDPLAVHLNSD